MNASSPLSATEASAIRTKLELSLEQLAYELGVTPQVVEAWERGAIGVPARTARELRWREAAVDRQRAIVESGLPECSWIAAWEKEPEPDKLDAHNARLERALEHVKTCETCQAREKFAQDHFGEMPERPMPAWLSAFGWIATRAERLPGWARPAVWVGLVFGAYSLFRILFTVPAMRSDPGLILTAILGLAASVSIGAAVGLVYGAFKALRSKWRAHTA